MYGGFVAVKGLDSLEMCKVQHPIPCNLVFNAEGFGRVYYTKMEKSQGLFIASIA